MNAPNLGRLIEDFRSCQDNLLRTKGNDYTMANEDRCHNFKVVAEMVGITPMQCWGVYYLKHVLAIATYVKHGKVESEGIYERFVDANNYAYLGLALIEDQRNEEAARNLAKSSSTQETPEEPPMPKVPFGRVTRSNQSEGIQCDLDSDSLQKPHSADYNANILSPGGIYRGL